MKREPVSENPVMTFPIKNRINSEMYIESVAALIIGETSIQDQEARLPTLKEKLHLVLNRYVDMKDCDNEKSGGNLPWNKFYRNLMKKDHFMVEHPFLR